jgi:hypothetical protein
MATDLAAGALVVLGILIAVLGLLAAGDMIVVVAGLASVFAGGLLGLLGRRRPA